VTEIERHDPQRYGEGSFRIRRYAEIDGQREPIEAPAQPAPMADGEITMVIEAVVAYEPWREVDHTLVDVWTAQAGIGRWTMPEALRAIHKWAATREPGTFLDPSVVTRSIRAEREDALSRAAAPERFTPSPDEDRARERVSRLNSIFESAGVKLRAGSVDDPTTFDPRGRHVPCSGNPDANSGDRGCGADVGDPCGLRVSDRRKRSTPGGFVHPSRLLRELDHVNAARAERGMPPLPASTAAPRLPAYARQPRQTAPAAPAAPAPTNPEG
jgi:hypothetical protein